MDTYKYTVHKNDSLNRWAYSELVKEKVEATICTFDAMVNMTEGYKEIEYPIRTEFLKNRHEISFPEKIDTPNFYYGFENPRVEFSTFQAIPQKLSTYLSCCIHMEEDEQMLFDLTTCGRAVLFLNQQLVEDFHPYTRNHGTKTTLSLSLKKGRNNLVIYMDDLAERDVNFFVELMLKSDTSLEVEVATPCRDNQLKNSVEFLESLYLEQDIYNQGDVRLRTSSNQANTELFLTYDPVYYSEEGGGDITDFERSDEVLTRQDDYFLIGKVEEMNTSGLTQFYVGTKLTNEQFLYKKFVFSIYKPKHLQQSLGKNLIERKNHALALFSELELNDMNSALASMFLGQTDSNQIKEKLLPAYKMIESRGDCADFMFAPLLSFVLSNEELPLEFTNKVKELALNFRYWIDEPGNDVMWYFSENHSLLFHTCQYFAGFLYKEERFVTSNRMGDEQYNLGKQRLIEWFHNFQSYGFSEWNSTTYLPIDLIGFFSLFNAAPDEEIRVLAKNALDFSFKVIAVNYHGRTMSSTFGRTYEHDLKAMRSGEISNILAIAWDAGNFNHALRASTLFAMSDYEPPKEYEAYLFLKEGEYLTANYIQGISEVETYLYKCNEYSLASAIQYNCSKNGHQQHMMNISLGENGTQLWINNPGEYAHSGENRPSYWAGNGSCPCIVQEKNEGKMTYDLSHAAIKMIHLYLPFWDITQLNTDSKNWLYVRVNDSYLAIHFSEGYAIQTQGDTRNREVISKGESHEVFIKCGSKRESETFEQFMKEAVASFRSLDKDSFQRKNKVVSYEIQPVISTY